MRALILALALLAATALPVRGADEAADASASLKVTVLDQTGAALVIARITLVDAAGGARTLQADERGVASFSGLAAGTFTLKAEAEAFQSYEGPITLRKGENAVSLKLPLAGLTEQVVVTQSQTDLSGNSFTTTLGEAEIAELPDDPDELQALLDQMAGPGATMRVNGFRGGRLPPKSQIRQIRFRMNSYAAENHESGGFGIDIQTKPGIDNWRGMSNFGFRDESLNARNAFAPTLGDEQYRRVGLEMSGPLVKNRTSIAFATDVNSSFDSKTIVAASPTEAIVSGQVRRPSDTLNGTVRLEHALTGKQTLLLEYQRRDDRRKNLGVGDFDLPSRAYTRTNAGNVFRTGLNGLVAPKIANELKFQYSDTDTDVYSLSTEPAVVVVDAFSTGGAGQQQNVKNRSVEIEDNVDFSFHKKHAVRAGLQLEANWYSTTQLRNGNGTFTFASLEAYEAGVPNTYTRRIGGTPVDFAQYQVGVYVQDDWTISKALSVSLGVRQELQNTLGDRLNLAPRVGFTWAPSKWTIRGGVGVFNDWYDASVYEQTLFVNGTNQQDLVILNPGYPDPSRGGTLSQSLPPSVIRALSGLSMPHLKQASIGAERNWGNLRLQTSYMIQRGTDQLRSYNANAPVPGAGRPDPAVGNVTEITSTGRTDSDRLQVNLNFARPEKRMFMGMNYILAHAKNYADSPLSLPSNSLDPDVDWGPSAQDVRHRVFAMASFGLPLKMRVFLNSQFQSASPYTIITGRDDNGDAVTNDRPAGVGRNSERGSATWNVGGRLSRAFSFGPPRPQSGQGGPGGGPIIRRGPGGPGGPGGGGGGPMMMGFDQGNGRYSVELYLQAFNLLNRVNYMNYSGSLRSPFYSQPTSAGPARRIEVGTMFRF